MARHAVNRTATSTYTTQYGHEGRRWCESIKATALTTRSCTLAMRPVNAACA